jgi:hypothetical protein
MYHGLQRQDTTQPFGAIPGTGEPYGFISSDNKGAVCAVINPSPAMAEVQLPASAGASNILYADGGFKPVLKGSAITLGPEQLAVVGFGEYAREKYSLGIDETINIPADIHKIDATFSSLGTKTIQASINPVKGKNLRIVFRQFYSNGDPCRSWLGAPPNGKKVNEVIKIQVAQNGKNIPQHIEYDKMIWSGLSWGVAEVTHDALDPAKPVQITCSTDEKNAATIKAQVYAVSYV